MNGDESKKFSEQNNFTSLIEEIDSNCISRL